MHIAPRSPGLRRFAPAAIGSFVLAGSAQPARAQDFHWILPGDGAWASDGAWDAPGYPDGTDHAAHFGPGAPSGAAVLVDRALTVGSIEFDSGGAYALFGASGTLVFETSVGPARVTVSDYPGGATHVIDVPMGLESDLILEVNGTSAEGLRVLGGMDGPGGLEKDGAGSAALHSATRYEGDTTINQGTLKLATRDDILPPSTHLVVNGSGVLDLDGNSQVVARLEGNGTVTNGLGSLGTFILDGSANCTFDGKITGPLLFKKNGASTLVLNDKQTYTRETEINDGVLKIGTTDCLPQLKTTIHGTLDLNGFDQRVSILRSYGTITNSGTGPRDLTVVGQYTAQPDARITGNIRLVKQGTATFTLTGPNSYSGDTLVQAGTLELSSTGVTHVLPETTVLRVSQNATVDLHGIMEDKIAGLDGMGKVTGTGGHTDLYVAVPAGATPSFSGKLVGLIALEKRGAGTQVLTGQNDYSGGTWVRTGKLQVDTPFENGQPGGTGTDDVVVEQGGTLDGTGFVQGDVTIKVGGTLAGKLRIGGKLDNRAAVKPGNSPGTLSVDGDFDQEATGTLWMEVGGAQPDQYDRLLVGGNANLGGDLSLVLIDGYQPTPGTSFDLLAAAQVIGQFASVDLPAGWQVQYLQNAVRATFVGTQVPILPLWGVFALLASLAGGGARGLRASRTSRE